VGVRKDPTLPLRGSVGWDCTITLKAVGGSEPSAPSFDPAHQNVCISTPQMFSGSSVYQMDVSQNIGGSVVGDVTGWNFYLSGSDGSASASGGSWSAYVHETTVVNPGEYGCFEINGTVMGIPPGGGSHVGMASFTIKKGYVAENDHNGGWPSYPTDPCYCSGGGGGTYD